MVDELDTLLSGSKPSVAPRSDDLRDLLNVLVADAETIVVPKKGSTRKRLGIAGLVSAGVLGLGLTAGATGLVQPPWWEDTSTPSYPGPSVHADSLTVGTDCKVVYGASEFEEHEHPVGKSERYRALEFARTFIRRFDISTISVPDAIASYEAQFARDAAASAPPGAEVSPNLRPDGLPDDIRTTAILVELDHILRQKLKAKGLSLHAVSAVAIPECRVIIPPENMDVP